MFDREWAENKLDMERRSTELTLYIRQHLSELQNKPAGLVVDIGPGPGDFLAMCKSMGHEVLGIDGPPDGIGGMGEAYCELCAEYWEEFDVNVYQTGLDEVLIDREDPLVGNGECVLIHSRGSIEQALSHCMVGPSHDIHHRADQLDWEPQISEAWFDLFFDWCERKLKVGGILMISANGTKSTDKWYQSMVTSCAERCGLKLKKRLGDLIHKWVK